MQYKKDDIKEKIDAAALAVFAEKGYKGAKISDIGERAGVSVGNIYRYYSSKADIFYGNIGQDFIEEARRLMAEKISVMKGREDIPEEGYGEFWLANEEVISFMLENRSKMIIVFGKSEGTRYENAKDCYVEFILQKVKESMERHSAGSEALSWDEFTAGIIYKSLIDMVLRILSASADAGTIRGCLRSVNTYHLFGITGFLAHKVKQPSM